MHLPVFRLLPAFKYDQGTFPRCCLYIYCMQDYYEGHIKGAQQVPSGKFGNESTVDSVIEKLPKQTKLVVVHCQLSQVRGPKCAKR